MPQQWSIPASGRQRHPQPQWRQAQLVGMAHFPFQIVKECGTVQKKEDPSASGWKASVRSLERGDLTGHRVLNLERDVRHVVGSGEVSIIMGETRTVRKRLLAVGAGFILLGGTLALPVLPATAGPSATQSVRVAAQNVDWLSSDAAASLNLGFTVLVPSWVPAPFGGAPSISTAGGYYSLYWMNAGGDPTFLQITGQVGGALPAGSPYDLNNQLFVNASVNGYDAIHDVTPIYDQVWWIQDGVLYNVNSKNMAGTDSLSLANSLTVLDTGNSGGDTPTTEPGGDNSAAWLSAPGSASSGDAVTVSVGDASSVNLTVDGGSFAETGDVGVYGVTGGSFTWNAPWVDAQTTFTFYLSDANTGETLSTSAITVSPQAPQPTSVPVTEVPPTQVPVTEVPPTDVPVTQAPAPVETQAAETVVPASDGSGGSAPVATVDTTGGDGTGVRPTVTPTSVSSDGTDGPARPVIGGDGTGGYTSVEVPTGSPYEP